jgi:hypothetical protein
MHAEGGGMACEIFGVKPFDGLGYAGMHSLPLKRRELTVRDGANPVMDEIELFANALQHPTPHELFDPLGGNSFVDPGGPLEQGKIEFASHNGRDRKEGSGLRAEPLQPRRDDLPNALCHW